MPYANTKGADQPAHPRSLISAFIVHCLDSLIHIVSISETWSLYLASVAAPAGLSLPWSQTPKTDFLVMRLICSRHIMCRFVFCLVSWSRVRNLTVLPLPFAWATTWQTQQNECAPSEASDQPGHPPNLIRVFAVCSMPRLIWIFAGRTFILLVLSCRGSFYFALFVLLYGLSLWLDICLDSHEQNTKIILFLCCQAKRE